MSKAINQAELNALSQAISNDARVLYLLGMRPGANSQTGLSKALNYKSLLGLLNRKEQKFSLGRQLNSLLKELVEYGLIHLPDELELSHSVNGKRLVMPLLAIKPDNYDSLHLSWQKMALNWLPDVELFNELTNLVGIIDKAYQPDELGDFIAYWLGRPEKQFTQFQWTQKFVFHIKQKRLAKGVKSVHKVGNQLVQPKAGLQADDNAKDLVAKYNKSTESNPPESSK